MAETATDREPVSVVLPTREWGIAPEQLAAQLRSGDELLLVADDADDPVVAAAERHDDGDGTVRPLVAGDPDGCSGKANAVAHAMERARNDRFVWTDDDFEREDDWLDQLVAAGREHGPVTAIPLFVGGRWWALFEPWVHVLSSLSFYAGVGPWAGNAWGGGVTFTRDDVDVDGLAAELRDCLSDDGLLSQRLDHVRPLRDTVEPVTVPGDARATKERLVRFSRLTHVHEGLLGGLVGLTLLAVLSVLFPVAAAAVTTVGMAVVYVAMGLRRWTFLLAFPGLLVAPLMPLAGIVATEFDWAGRRYRLDGPCDVTVVDAGA